MTRRKRNNYWQERAAAERKWQEEQLKNDADFTKILNRPYQVAADEINKEIADKAAKIGGIQNMVKPENMAEYERLAQDAVQKANRLRALHGHVHYTDFSDDVNRRLKLYNATMQINQLELLKSTMGVHLVDLGMETQTSIGDKLYGDYLKERKRQAGILGMAANARSQKVTTATLDSIPSSVAGAEFSKRVWSNVDLLKANLDGILATGFVRGDSIQDMTRYIKQRVGDTMKTGSYAAERLARTESARVQFEAQKESLKDNDYKHCKWYAEPSACNICKEYASGSSSKKYPEGVYDTDDVPDIPVHPNCRCSIGAYWIDDDEIADKPIADKVAESESGYGKRVGSNKINRDYIRSAAFRSKFDKASNNPVLHAQLQKYAVAMLIHRNGTDGEDSYIFDKNGQVISKSFGKADKLEVGISKQTARGFQENYNDGTIVGMHNHPTNIPPTGSDFTVSNTRKYKFGIVVTHSGRVFKYSMSGSLRLPILLDRTIAKIQDRHYNWSNEKVFFEAIKELRKEGFKCVELK